MLKKRKNSLVRFSTIKPKTIYDSLGRVLKDGDLFIFVDSDCIPKVGLASIPFNSELSWFNVVYTDPQLYQGKKEFWKLDPPLEKFIVFRETRDFSSIPNLGYITILDNINLTYGRFYKKFW